MTKNYKQTAYSKKLLDPRWQKKRLEIMQRDNFSCTCCGDKETTLHVHHKCYKTNYEPWDIEDEHLITLCEDCHKLEEEQLKEYSSLFIQSFRESEFMADDLRELAWGVNNVTLTDTRSYLVAEAYSFAFISTNIQKLLLHLVSEYKRNRKEGEHFNDFVESKLNR